MTLRIAAALFLSLAALGCGSESVAGPSGDDVVVQPIEIETVEVIVGSARPALVVARVDGQLGSGCDFLHSITQRREGNVITVSVERARFTAGPCTAILKLFQQELGLPGPFAPGSYTVRVNGVSRTFSVS
jgi:hypothetical protein